MNKWCLRAALHLPLSVGGALLVGAGLFVAQGIEALLGMALSLIAVLFVVLGSLKLSRRALPLPTLWCIIVAGTAGLAGVVIGRVSFERVLINQIPHLERELAASRTIPNLFDVKSSPYFRRVHVSRAREGIRARFGLPDGSVVLHVSDPVQWTAEERRPCTRELRPGWYRRWRCE